MSQLAFGDRLDRWILKKGFRAGRPLSALTLIEARRIAADPVAHLKSRSAARSIVGGSKWADFIPRKDGYRLFSSETFPELRQTAAACQSVYADHRAELTGNPNIRWLFNILTADDLHRHPVLVDFALSAPVTEVVTGYLGQVPRLNSIGVYYSAVNDTIDGSQMYHVDGDALAQVKCFVNVWDVGPGGGAFTFAPKRHTSYALRRGGLLKTISDKDIAGILPESQQIALTGPSGTGVFIDTSGCLHYGSRARQQPRLVYHFQYLTRPDASVEKLSQKPVPGLVLLITRQVCARLTLGNPKAMMFVD